MRDSRSLTEGAGHAVHMNPEPGPPSLAQIATAMQQLIWLIRQRQESTAKERPDARKDLETVAHVCEVFHPLISPEMAA